MNSKSSPEIHGEAQAGSGVGRDQTRPPGIPGHRSVTRCSGIAAPFL